MAKTQADQLALYHLAEAFGVDDADAARLEETENTVFVTLERKGKKVTEKAVLEPGDDRKHARDAAVGLAFARAAEKLGGEIPPYGTLTGVRPVKAALRLLNQGLQKDAVSRTLSEKFLVSPEKAALLANLAEIERREARPGEVMLYVSIPFCPSRCHYCSFISHAAPKHLAMIPAYLDLLKKDLFLAGEALRDADKSVSAVYVGGGTPGVLEADQLSRLLNTVREKIPLEENAEFTVEIGRPDTVTREKLAILARGGVGRICINPQSTRDVVLARIGRGHSAADFFRAMEEARAFPFAVNCDLIAGLSGDDKTGFLTSVREVLSLSPDNLTIHALCLKKAAADQGKKDGFPGIREAVAEAHRLCIEQELFPYYLYRQKMAAAGLENLGFARKGALGRYNLCMMEDLTSVVGCGAGAIGKVIRRDGGKILRFPQMKYPFEYTAKPEHLSALHRAFFSALKENE